MTKHLIEYVELMQLAEQTNSRKEAIKIINRATELRQRFKISTKKVLFATNSIDGTVAATSV